MIVQIKYNGEEWEVYVNGKRVAIGIEHQILEAIYGGVGDSVKEILDNLRENITKGNICGYLTLG